MLPLRYALPSRVISAAERFRSAASSDVQIRQRLASCDSPLKHKEPDMGLVKEFKEFAMRGNVMDMAVGIIIGAAFSGIVNSFVKDVLMPPLGVMTGGVDFSDKKL